MEQLTGRTLGDFVVRHRIGAGGFGEVYRAEQPVLGREAVIKVLHSQHRRSKTLIQRFLREARLASKLDHPYAAHIYAFGVEADGLMWIAMEYVRGQTLHDLLRAKGKIALDELVPLLDRVCEVLQAAHELGIVHRDIKPPNVMVVQRSGRAFPKLLDFGIAKLNSGEMTPLPEPVPRPEVKPDARAVTAPLVSGEGRTVPAPDAKAATSPSDHTVSFVGAPGGALANLPMPAPPVVPAAPPRTLTDPPTPSDAEPALTEAGATMGSPPYMAPEQWDDSSAVTGRTDIYSLGVLAFEALTGRRPFPGPALTSLAIDHATKPVPPLGEGFPPALDAVIAKAMAKDPGERYATALELAADFRAAAGFGDQPMPAFDEDLRISIETGFPQPIAEAVAAYHGARNPHHAREALRTVVTTAIRYMTLIMISAHAQVRLTDTAAEEALARAVRELRRRALTDEEWLELGRELARPYARQRNVHPVPELVAILEATSEGDALAVAVRAKELDSNPLRQVRAALADVTRLLRALTFLADVPLVVVDRGRAESWMGLRRQQRVGVELHGRAVEPGHPVLVDRANHPVVALWPLMQVSSPLVGASPELFMLDGRGRRGARLLALPQPLERQDDAVWDWLGKHFAERSGDKITPSGEATAAPFRGLAAFTADDAGAFVGREREIDAALNRLKLSSLIAVVGPSGAGKSSFVHAGIVPSLPDGWSAISVRPGPQPLATLEARLRKANPRPQVLVVDQFEELFTLGATVEQQREYVRELLELSRAPDDPVRVILTLRDDFLARATQLAELRDALASSLFLLGTPERVELIRILTEPLARAGFDFDDRSLPVHMVDAVEATPGALALLSFTAQKLWELRDRHFRQLTRRAYEALGGVAGAIAQHAETTLAAMSAHEQKLARIALGHLVTAEGTRAVLSRAELYQLMGDPQAESVIEKLIAARLLTATEAEGNEDRVELVHETLLVNWPRLASWRREDAEGARLRDQIRAAARQWHERGEARGLLWRDDALAELRVWRARNPQPLTLVDEAFIRASFADAARGRRLRRGIIASLLALAGVAVVVLVGANRRAAHEREVAEHESATARRLEGEAEQGLTKQYFQRGRDAMVAGDAALALAYLDEAFQRGIDGPGVRMLLAAAESPLAGQVRVLRHKDKVNGAMWSADGTRLLSYGFDSAARLWDVQSGRELATLPANGNVLNAELGATITTASHDNVVRVYRADGTLLHELTGIAGVRDAASSPDGTLIAIAATSGVTLWNAETGQLVTKLADWGALHLAFSSDGRRLVAAGEQGTMFDVAARKPLRALEGHTDTLQSVRFSRDGKVLVTTSVDQTARLWDGATGAPLAVLRGAAGIVGDAVFSPDATRVVTVSRDGVARVYRVPDGQFLLQLEGHATGVTAAAFDPSGMRVATAGADGRAILWDAISGAPLASMQGHVGKIKTVEFSPNGRQIATASFDGTVRIWEPRLTPLHHLLAQPVDVADAQFSPDGKLIASITDDGKVRLWDVASGELIATLEGHSTAVGAVRFTSDGSRLVTGDRAGTLIAWDVATRHELARIDVAAAVTKIATAPDGTIAVADAKGGVRRWTLGAAASVVDVPTGRAVTALAFSHDGTRLAWGRDDGIVRELHDAKVAELRVSRVWEISFAPDDRRMVIAHDTAASVVDVDSLAVAQTLSHAGFVFTARFRPDGQQIVTASEDGTAVLWNAATGARESVLRGHSSLVTEADYDRTGRFVVTAGDDRAARLWDASSGDLLQRLVAHSIGVAKAHFDPTGTQIATIGYDRLVALWNVELEVRDRAAVAAFAACHDPWQIVSGSPQLRDPECR